MLKKLAGLFSKKSETELVPPVRLEESRRRVLLETANKALNGKDHAKLEETLLVLLKADKRDPEAVTLDGLRLFVLRNFGEAVAALETAISLNTSDARAYKFLAESLFQLGRFREGMVYSNDAYKHFPTDSAVLYVRGSLFSALEDFENAAVFMNKALEYAPDELALLILSNFLALETQGRAQLRKEIASERAIQARKRLLRQLIVARKKRPLNEEESVALMVLAKNTENFSVALDEANRIYAKPLPSSDEALFAAHTLMTAGDVKRAIEMWEQLGSNIGLLQQFTFGMLKAAAGKKYWADGWRLMTEGLSTKNIHAQLGGGLPQWTGGRLGNKKLLVYQDQGFGDNLIALRLLRALRERKIEVVFVTHRDMDDMIRSAELGIEVVCIGDAIDPRALGCGAAVALFNLVHVLQLTPEYLKAPVLIKPPVGLCEEWVERLKSIGGIKVGVVASGNPWRQDDWLRTVPVSALQCLKRIQGVSWVNLAFDKRPERDQVIELLSALDPTPDFKNFSDTAAVIASLDLVVAIDCSVAHLAGALGKKVLVLAPSAIDWRWIVGDDSSPFWPSSEVFRAEGPGRWESAMERLSTRLEELLAR